MNIIIQGGVEKLGKESKWQELVSLIQIYKIKLGKELSELARDHISNLYIQNK